MNTFIVLSNGVTLKFTASQLLLTGDKYLVALHVEFFTGEKVETLFIPLSQVVTFYSSC
jgi:hypothetical protein